MGGKPKIVAKHDPSVSNSAWKALFRWKLTSILLTENWVSWISPNIWRNTVSKWTYWLLKEGDNLERSCIVHVGAIFHDYQEDGASWSRKCWSWKDCPDAWAQLSTKNVNFCTRSRPYQREASRPSGPGHVFFSFFSQPPTPRRRPNFMFQMQDFKSYKCPKKSICAGLRTMVCPPPKLSFCTFFHIFQEMFFKEFQKECAGHHLSTFEMTSFINSKIFSTFHGVSRLFAKTKVRQN